MLVLVLSLVLAKYKNICVKANKKYREEHHRVSKFNFEGVLLTTL